jgi:hypothetical protein
MVDKIYQGGVELVTVTSADTYLIIEQSKASSVHDLRRLLQSLVLTAMVLFALALGMAFLTATIQPQPGGIINNSEPVLWLFMFALIFQVPIAIRLLCGWLVKNTVTFDRSKGWIFKNDKQKVPFNSVNCVKVWTKLEYRTHIVHRRYRISIITQDGQTIKVAESPLFGKGEEIPSNMFSMYEFLGGWRDFNSVRLSSYASSTELLSLATKIATFIGSTVC